MNKYKPIRNTLLKKYIMQGYCCTHTHTHPTLKNRHK